MNKLLKSFLAIAIIAVITFADVEINETTFPDANFRAWVLSQDWGKDGVITDAEIDTITYIMVNSKDISSLKGIEYFTALTYLYCNSNLLESLDVSLNTALTELYCHENQLISLDMSNNPELKYLFCYDNKLVNLDVSLNTALKDLRCDHNYIPEVELPVNNVGATIWKTLPQRAGVPINKTTFPDDNFRTWILSKNYGDGNTILTDAEIADITSISVSDNSISSLKGIEYFTELTSLSCSFNQLTELDVSANTELTYLYCPNNQLTSLNVSANTELTYLSCFKNELTSLDVSENTALTGLNCSDNELTSLDVSSNTALTSLDCSDNYIPEVELPVNNVGATIWTTLPQYIVAVFMNGEEIYHSDTVTTESGTITKPTDPAKTGYTFNGWYKEAALTNLWDFDTLRKTAKHKKIAENYLHVTAQPPLLYSGI